MNLTLPTPFNYHGPALSLLRVPLTFSALFLVLTCAPQCLTAQVISQSELVARAQTGDAQSQLVLGESYLRDKDSSKHAEALSLIRASADQGNVNAQRKLGSIYYFGQGVQVSGADAVRWLMLASEQNDGLATFMLATIILQGEAGVKKDRKEGIRLMQKSVDRGETAAMCMLGAFYLTGERNLIKKDAKRGVALFRQAADAGNPKAQSTVGRWLVTGEYGVVPDNVEALKLLKPRAQRGDGEAAEMYGAALVKERNYKEACAWFLVAHTLGSKDTALSNYINALAKTDKDKKAREVIEKEILDRRRELLTEIQNLLFPETSAKEIKSVGN